MTGFAGHGWSIFAEREDHYVCLRHARNSGIQLFIRPARDADAFSLKQMLLSHPLRKRSP